MGVGSVSEVQGQGAAKSYPLPKGQMKLQLPAGWIEESKNPKPGTPLTISYRPLEGNRFLIRLIASWDEKAGSSFNSDARLQEIAMAAGNQFLPRSVENQVKLRDIKGDMLRGYCFVLTDKAPRAGDYEIMAQGAAALGELLILFTYLGYRGGDAELQRLIEVLQGARLIQSAPKS